MENICTDMLCIFTIFDKRKTFWIFGGTMGDVAKFIICFVMGRVYGRQKVFALFISSKHFSPISFEFYQFLSYAYRLFQSSWSWPCWHMQMSRWKEFNEIERGERMQHFAISNHHLSKVSNKAKDFIDNKVYKIARTEVHSFYIGGKVNKINFCLTL